ncbi:MAG: glycine betaine ABC transporter substrate-binding protein [Tissierellia bacterium]|nr:glycine betaine ABC transporter substrate-binding protein [Tissierellia bacterium]
MGFIEYFIANGSEILSLLGEHIRLTAFSLFFALLIGIPGGILITNVKWLNRPILGIANVMQAIPSMALLGFAIPLLGIGSLPAIVVVILYSLLPIIKNTYTGLSGIDPNMMEAAKGIGMKRGEILRKIQLPLALPVIMTGVRVSAVTAVGLMTIAAFIGAGGLGTLVFAGIRTVNNYQILAGAIPACILALIVDFLGGAIEFLITPPGMTTEYLEEKEEYNKTKKRKKWGLGLATAFILVAFLSQLSFGGKGNKDEISIGMKDFTEHTILGHLVAEYIEENSDIKVNRRLNLGGTQVVFSALKSGDIDFCVDYTGTAYGDILNYPPSSDMDQVYETVKKDYKEKFNFDVLDSLNFNNTYALAVKEETAKEFNLKTIKDFVNHQQELRLGFTLEFINRDDGLQGLQKAYHFEPENVLGIDGSNRYVALMNGDTDVTDVFSTDGLLKKYNLVVLEDTDHFFPPYYAIPVIREEVLEEHPELEELFQQLGEHFSDEVLTDLNYKVDELHEKPEDVAHEFLVENNLI